MLYTGTKNARFPSLSHPTPKAHKQYCFLEGPGRMAFPLGKWLSARLLSNNIRLCILYLYPLYTVRQCEKVLSREPHLSPTLQMRILRTKLRTRTQVSDSPTVCITITGGLSMLHLGCPALIQKGWGAPKACASLKSSPGDCFMLVRQ